MVLFLAPREPSPYLDAEQLRPLLRLGPFVQARYSSRFGGRKLLDIAVP